MRDFPPDQIKLMLECGNATYAHLAKHFNVTVMEMNEYCKAHGLSEPNPLAQRHITKLYAAERAHKFDLDQLFYDDHTRHVINGIDLHTTDGRVNAQEIIKYYHGDVRCWFTGEITDTVLSVDGNPQNFLCSNILPIRKDVVDSRFLDSPLLLSAKTYRLTDRIHLRITLEGRVDKLFGAVLKPAWLDMLVEQWIAPYFEHPVEKILPAGLPLTSEILALWLWQRLEKAALVKGLAQLRLKYGGSVSYLTKQSVLLHTMQLMQNVIKNRKIVTTGRSIQVPSVVPPPQSEAKSR